MTQPRQPVVPQLCDTITVPVTPSFKQAVRRGAAKRHLSVAEFARAALSAALTAGHIRHRRPDGQQTKEGQA